MSDQFAIALVTASLAQLLTAPAQSAVGSALVRTASPVGVGDAGPPATGVNVYLYQVSENGALRNQDLPSRSGGQLIQRTQAALDLHYLLTFHGSDIDLEPQRLLGATVRALHEQPWLDRDRIRATQKEQMYDYLKDADLAEAVELVRFSPLPLSLEELSKLWSVFFQKTYALSVAYQASVVLIEGKATPQTALPVRGRNIYVIALQQPTIERVEAAEGAGHPIVRGGTLRLYGRHLHADAVRVAIGDCIADLEASAVLDAQLEVVLDSPPFTGGDLQAGVQGIQVVQPRWMGTPPVEHGGAESNVAAFVLCPTITQVNAANAEVVVTVKPEVGAGQRVALLLNEKKSKDAAAYAVSLPSPTQATDTLTLSTASIAAGTYFVRVQVDGAESPLDLDPNSTTFGPVVTIP